MTLDRCPYCRSWHVEEHGTEPGQYNWWLCRDCGGVIPGNDAEYRALFHEEEKK